MDNRSYYDEFSRGYERERGRGYHQMLDDLEVDLLERFGTQRSILEVGCGTGLILSRAATVGRDVWGVDLSAGMLSGAKARGLNVVQGTATALPFPDARFDVVCSFKVLSHVQAIQDACAEMARVTKPGGTMLLEFYNTWSLRYLIKRLKPPTAISEATSDEAVYTRYDDLATAQSYLPPGVRMISVRGVRIATPAAFVYKIPGLGRAFDVVERRLADAPGFRRLGGFMILIAQKG